MKEPMLIKRELKEGTPHYLYRYGDFMISRLSNNHINSVYIWNPRGELHLPLEEEYSLLERFGFDLDRPIEEALIPVDYTKNTAHHFSQEPDLSIDSLTKDTDRIPGILYFLVSLQAMAKGISRVEYVNNLRDMLDMAYDNKFDPGDEETADHVREIREHFEKRPTKWQYFKWLYEKEEEKTGVF